MSVLIYNAKIYLERGRFAEALLVEGGLIKAVGSMDELTPLVPADARRYDAGGRLVLPGFNDSHQHTEMVGELLGSIRLLGADSIAEVQRRIRAFIEENHPAPGTVLTGMGWNQDYFTDEPRLLRKEDLDEVTTEYPLLLQRACGHITVASSSAIERAGVTRETEACEGGAIDRDENGELTGIFRENAANQVNWIREAGTVSHIEGNLRRAMKHAAACGVTSVQTMDIKMPDWKNMMEAYRRVQADQPTLRVYHQCNFMTAESYQAFLDAGYRTGDGDAFNRIGPLKLFVDGSLGARTALMRAPYHDDPTTRGISTLSCGEFQRIVRMATEHGCQVVTHAIGDGAIEMVLDAYDAVCRNGQNPLRHGVIHCQITDEPLLKRFAANDILALVQPIFLHYDTSIVEDRVGKELAATSYAFETLRKLGVHESFGTDSPVEDMNPIDNIYCAVTRKNLHGEPAGGFHPEECMDIYDAVDAYTKESAYVSFEEGKKGRLFAGYYADLVILSQDLFTIPANRLLETRVDATMVDGRFVYERDC